MGKIIRDQIEFMSQLQSDQYSIINIPLTSKDDDILIDETIIFKFLSMSREEKKKYMQENEPTTNSNSSFKYLQLFDFEVLSLQLKGEQNNHPTISNNKTEMNQIYNTLLYKLSIIRQKINEFFLNAFKHTDLGTSPEELLHGQQQTSLTNFNSFTEYRLTHYDSKDRYQPGDVIFDEHKDFGLLTFCTLSNIPGLEIFNQRLNQWIAVEQLWTENQSRQKNNQERILSLLVFAGETMEHITSGKIKAAEHRVVQYQHEKQTKPSLDTKGYIGRVSSIMFLRAHPSARVRRLVLEKEQEEDERNREETYTVDRFEKDYDSKMKQ